MTHERSGGLEPPIIERPRSISAPVRKGLIVRRLAEANPHLGPGEIGRLAGSNYAHAKKSMTQEKFGRDKPKSRAKPLAD